jgi:hypothetical protein
MGSVIPPFPLFSRRGRPAGRIKKDVAKTEVKRGHLSSSETISFCQEKKIEISSSLSLDEREIGAIV